LSYTFDPYHPILLNGASILDADRGGMRREIRWCDRPDAFLFLSPTLKERIPIAGEITLRLKVSVGAVDGAIFARLILITPEGEAFNLRESAMLLSHREGDFSLAPVTPGVEYPITLTFPSLRWTLTPGFSLGLALSSSGVPFIPPYTHTGRNWLFSPEAFPATYTYRFDAETYLEIPTE
jgi:predicted acyl esterase